MSEKHVEVTVSFLCDPDELDWILRRLNSGDEDRISLTGEYDTIADVEVRNILVDGN